jgi:hypothetical protein
MLRPVLTWRVFWNLWTIISLIFQIFSGHGKLQILNPWIQGSACTQNITNCQLICLYPVTQWHFVIILRIWGTHYSVEWFHYKLAVCYVLSTLAMLPW